MGIKTLINRAGLTLMCTLVILLYKFHSWCWYGFYCLSYINSIMQIWSNRFYHVDFVIRFIMEILLYRFYYMRFIIWILLCGFYCAVIRSIAQLLFCRFFLLYANSRFYCALYSADPIIHSIMQITLYRVYSSDFIFQILSFKFYSSDSIF